MAHLRMTSHFDAPIDRVFELGADFKRYPEWNVSYDKVIEVTGPGDRVGTRVHGIMKVLGRTMDGWGEVVEVEKPRHLKMVGSGPEKSKLAIDYLATSAGTGTDLVTEIDYELPAGVLGQIADKLFAERTVERDLRHSMENFKALVEHKVPVTA